MKITPLENGMRKIEIRIGQDKIEYHRETTNLGALEDAFDYLKTYER